MKILEETGVIVILDALGTKGIWNRTPDVKKYVQSWEDLAKEWKKNFEFPVKDSDFKNKLTAFSDTIIIKNTGKNMDLVLTAAAHNTSIVILDAISKGIFLRGCISVGQIFSSDNMIIGKAIDEAAEYYTMPDWIGLSASPSAYNAIQKLRAQKKLKTVNDQKLFVDYDIPLKAGIEKGIAINYFSPLDDGWGEDFFKIKLKALVKLEILKIFQNQLDSLSDLNASLKIRNSIEFLKHVS